MGPRKWKHTPSSLVWLLAPFGVTEPNKVRLALSRHAKAPLDVRFDMVIALRNVRLRPKADIRGFSAS